MDVDVGGKKCLEFEPVFEYSHVNFAHEQYGGCLGIGDILGRFLKRPFVPFEAGHGIVGLWVVCISRRFEESVIY